MLDHIREALDLSYTPSWSELVTEVAAAVVMFFIPVAFALVAVAFGWGP